MYHLIAQNYINRESFEILENKDFYCCGTFIIPMRAESDFRLRVWGHVRPVDTALLKLSERYRINQGKR